MTYVDLPIRSTRRTDRSPAYRPPTSPTTACCVPRRATSSTCTAAPSIICAEHETIGLQTLVIHNQFGGRPLITAVLTELLEYMQKSRDAWFTSTTRWPTGR